MAKNWYSYFVTVDPQPGAKQSGRAEPSESGTAAQTIAEIAASVNTHPTFTTPPPSSATFDEIYQAAEIRQPAHGYTVFKVANMLHSEHIRNLPADVKRSSVLVALEAAGVKLPEIIEDAVRRDRALDTFELVQQRSVEEMDQRINQENQQIQAEMDRLLEEHRARIDANNKKVAIDKERFFQWRLKKQEEEQRIFDTVSHFAAENPISRGAGSEPKAAKSALHKE